MSESTSDITQARLNAIKEQNKKINIPPCRVCGAELSIASSYHGYMGWVCSVAQDDYRNQAEHYELSQFYERLGDLEKLDLVAALEEAWALLRKTWIALDMTKGEDDLADEIMALLPKDYGAKL